MNPTPPQPHPLTLEKLRKSPLPIGRALRRVEAERTLDATAVARFNSAL